MQTEAHNAYAAALYARVGEAALLPHAQVGIGEWQPQLNDCHANVTELCAAFPEYAPVRGWLYFDLAGQSEYVKFVAHSAVRAPDGIIYDITPNVAMQQYPFLPATEPEAQYAALIESGVTSLWHHK